jgi:hypothetical protein
MPILFYQRLLQDEKKEHDDDPEGQERERSLMMLHQGPSALRYRLEYACPQHSVRPPPYQYHTYGKFYV